MVVVDVETHSENVKVFKCDFKPGSVERSIDLVNKGIPLETICSNAATNENQEIS
jgi:hypothetical protein